MSTPTQSSAPEPVSERLRGLRELLDSFEERKIETLEHEDYVALGAAINAVWPKTYIVDTWYDRAERAGLIVIGALLGAFGVSILGHLIGPEVAKCTCPKLCL